MNDKDLDNALILTRAFRDSNLKPFLEHGAEVAPSIAAHKYHPKSKSGAMGFGDYTFLANPEELNPQRNFIYRHDAYTPYSPPLIPKLNDEKYKEFQNKYGEMPSSVLDTIAGTNLNIDDMPLYHGKNPEYILPAYKKWAAARASKKGSSYDDFIKELQGYLKNNSSGLGSSIPLTEESLRGYLANTQADNAPYYLTKLDKFKKPFQSEGEMQDFIKHHLTHEKAGGESFDRTAYALSDALNDKYNPKADSDITDALEDYVRYGYDREAIAPEKIFREAKIAPKDLDEFLENTNALINNPGSNRGGEHEHTAADEIRGFPSDYLEIKPPRVLSPADYRGVIYPQFDKGDLEELEDEEEGGSEPSYRENVSRLNKIYGANAIPYKSTPAILRNSRTEKLHMNNKIAALGELMRKAGVQ